MQDSYTAEDLPDICRTGPEQCRSCRYKARNTWGLVDKHLFPTFCLKAENVRDEWASVLIGEMMISLAEMGRCKSWERLVPEEVNYRLIEKRHMS